MKKEILNKFMTKYSLSNLIESVKWDSVDNKLITNFISDDKSVLGKVTYDGFSFENSEIGVYDTSKLAKILSVMDDEVELSLNKSGDTPVSIRIKDSKSNANYVLADISVIPKAPTLKKLPDWDISIQFDQDMISRFIRAKGALPEADNFTIFANSSTNDFKISIGHSDNTNTNKIDIKVAGTAFNDFGSKSISFSAVYLKEIFTANRDAKDAVLNLSFDGLSHISFLIDEFTSEYYLTEKKI
jgi:hypothetical protein